MPATQETLQKQSEYTTNRSWFIAFSVAMVFGIVWTILGESSMKVVFATVAFICFLRAGINLEMSARKLSGPHGH